MISPARKNKSHKAITFEGYQILLNEERPKHRLYVDRVISRCLDFIGENGIKDKCKIVKYLLKIGLKSADIQNIIIEFKNQYNKQAEKEIIKWFSRRDVRQLTFSGKNNLLAVLAVQYKDEFIEFMNNYFKDKNDKKVIKQINKIKKNIQKMYDISQSLFPIDNKEDFKFIAISNDEEINMDFDFEL
ncbi:hypothetical protein M9Y10_021303 [Tritrichomonas musculus]|uniref:Uncharacterized protein n=1 Tax=Tritrichomonas musculus TaxID=1915356 RepID=A0ABR2HDK6_9EUKA